MRGPRDGITVLEWAAEHAAELGADPRRLLVAGEGAGAAVEELRCAVADLGQVLRRSLTDESARSATSSQRPR